MNIRTKAIILVLFLITCMTGAYLSISIKHQHQDLENKILTKKKSALFLAEMLQEQAFSNYRTRIVSLATTKQRVIEAFAKRDRVSLQQSVAGFYNVLKKENPHFRNMQFNLPDGTAFLRMHFSEFHGDDLSNVRPILNHVHRVQEQTSGYEIGRSGLFYRVVHPMFYQGKYIGSIGFGIKFEQLLELLQKQISPHLALVTSTSNWQKVTHFDSPVIQHGPNVIISHNGELFSALPPLSNTGTEDERIRFNERDFLVFSNITLNTYKTEPLAKIFVALDITDDLKSLNRFITQIVLLTLSLLTLTALILHFSFDKLLNTIINLNSSLAQANEELEERVLERTAELAESNLALKKEMEERQRIESDLRQMEKMQAIGTLASGIAHDFNNILTAILGYTQLTMQKLPPDRDDLSLHLGKVEKAGMRAKDLVAQILAFSRQVEHKSKVIRLHPVILEALKLLRATIPANINIVQNIDTECCPTLADPSQIHQVMMNLCINAYHAMLDDGGQLIVSLSQTEMTEENCLLNAVPGSYLKLEVSDTGCGMENKILERIFEPYFTTKDTGNGTGLGLAVVHGIVTNANGHIMAQSTFGQGTTFTLLFPCYLEDDIDKEQVTNDRVAMGKGEHLLVVEDEKEVMLYWEILLEEMGYQVTIMEDSTAAYQWLTEHVTDIDAVITDMSMPKMTGLELSKKIKEIAPSMPIALCSGFSNSELQKKVAAYGIESFIKKPLNKIHLSHTLRSLLS